MWKRVLYCVGCVYANMKYYNTKMQNFKMISFISEIKPSNSRSVCCLVYKVLPTKGDLWFPRRRSKDILVCIGRSCRPLRVWPPSACSLRSLEVGSSRSRNIDRGSYSRNRSTLVRSSKCHKVEHRCEPVRLSVAGWNREADDRWRTLRLAGSLRCGLNRTIPCVDYFTNNMFVRTRQRILITLQTQCFSNMRTSNQMWNRLMSEGYSVIMKLLRNLK